MDSDSEDEPIVQPPRANPVKIVEIDEADISSDDDETFNLTGYDSDAEINQDVVDTDSDGDDGDSDGEEDADDEDSSNPGRARWFKANSPVNRYLKSFHVLQ